jgi:hypothetical protein
MSDAQREITEKLVREYAEWLLGIARSGRVKYPVSIYVHSTADGGLTLDSDGDGSIAFIKCDQAPDFGEIDETTTADDVVATFGDELDDELGDALRDAAE